MERGEIVDHWRLGEYITARVHEIRNAAVVRRVDGKTASGKLVQQWGISKTSGLDPAEKLKCIYPHQQSHFSSVYNFTQAQAINLFFIID